MSSRISSGRVVIAGGGIAALEATLALRALAGDRVQITLVAPDPELTFRAPAALEAFGRGGPSHYELAAIARDLEVSLRAGRLEAVAPRARTVRLATGHRLEYDALILAIGARASACIPGALTFRDHRDAPALRRILSKLDSGKLTQLAFAVPPGRAWSLPLYELALLSGRRAGRSASGAEVVLLSPERRPLEVFGAEASRLVEEELSAAGVRFIGDAAAVAWRDGAVELQGATPITAGRVVTVPLLRVPRMAGIPASWWGFVPTDTFGRVEGLSDVYAAGDMTTYPVKQGGLAAQQADRIAHTIAASLGAAVKEARPSHVLRARLLGGERPLLLRAELDWQGQPVRGSADVGEPDDADSGGKVFGRYLTPYLEGLGRKSPLAA